jgi:hypothetical protein
LLGCGKKGNPTPKALPQPPGITDLRADPRDGVVFVSFSVPARNRDGTPSRNFEGFRIFKACGTCAGALEPWKDIRLTDRQGYTIRNGRFYTYDNEQTPGYNYNYRVFPLLQNGIVGEGSNIPTIKWQKPPQPPRDIKAAEEESTIILSWAKEDGLLYNVYRYEDDIYPVLPVNTAPLAAPEFRDSNLTNGRQYRYEVRAVQIEAQAPYEGRGTSVLATPRHTTPPSAPGDLKAQKTGRAVSLTWSPPVGRKNVAGYNVYRTGGGKTGKINRALITGAQYVDQAPGNLPYVSYRVTSVDTSGLESTPSREQIVILKE